jgi:hypothetical protein
LRDDLVTLLDRALHDAPGRAEDNPRSEACDENGARHAVSCKAMESDGGRDKQGNEPRRKMVPTPARIQFVEEMFISVLRDRSVRYVWVSEV